MGYQFTPAVERALNAAAQWSATSDGIAGTLGLPEVLLGLLHEPECRAAKFLAAHKVDASAVRARFPQLTPLPENAANTFAARGLSVEVEGALRDAAERLDESPRSFQFATEHVLFGLTLGHDEAGNWLREQGVTPEAMEADQAQRLGGDRTPIAVDLGPIALAEFVTETIFYDEPPPSATVRHESNAALRILDASANRAGEALRVVEDYVRFVRDDAVLTQLCKEMRHELTAALATIPLDRRLAARDTAHDVGTDVTTAAEMVRRDPADVANANCRRLQESLRSLEEFAKLVDPIIAGRCEQLRYRSYELQKALAAAGAYPQRLSHPSLSTAQLYVLVDGRRSEAEFDALITTLIQAGVDVLQFRDKQLDDRTLLARGRRLRELTRDTATLFVMNDRPDLAVLCEADGVHVGQEELSVAEARRIVGANCLIGVSTHSIKQARQAVADGADYLGIGPTFPSSTKSFDAFPGLDFVKAVAAEIQLPAFAIGGITPANVAEVVQAGLRRVAVSGAVTQAADPAAVVHELRRQLAVPTKPPIAQG